MSGVTTASPQRYSRLTYRGTRRLARLALAVAGACTIALGIASLALSDTLDFEHGLNQRVEDNAFTPEPCPSTWRACETKHVSSDGYVRWDCAPYEVFFHEWHVHPADKLDTGMVVFMLNPLADVGAAVRVWASGWADLVDGMHNKAEGVDEDVDNATNAVIIRALPIVLVVRATVAAVYWTTVVFLWRHDAKFATDQCRQAAAVGFASLFAALLWFLGVSAMQADLYFSYCDRDAVHSAAVGIAMGASTLGGISVVYPVLIATRVADACASPHVLLVAPLCVAVGVAGVWVVVGVCYAHRVLCASSDEVS